MPRTSKRIREQKALNETALAKCKKTEKEVVPIAENEAELINDNEIEPIDDNEVEPIDEHVNEGNLEERSLEVDNEKLSLLEVLIKDDSEIQKLLNYYVTELLHVNESPEEREEINKHPEIPIMAMRDTSSSNIIYGLLAGWIRELQKIKSKQPDVCFRELLALTTSAFNDEHWICDTDGPDIVCFLVNEMGILWNFILKKSNEVLKISDPIRKDLKNLFKLYKKKLKSLSEDYETPIEFALTSIRLKNTKENYCLDEIIEMGADIKRCIASYKV